MTGRIRGAMHIVPGMRFMAGLLLLLAFLALPANAGQRSQSFQVGAVVVRSARLRLQAARLQLSTREAAAVAIDAAPAQLVARDVELPPGAVRVTVQY